MDKQTCDIAIIGGGPAGLAAAISCFKKSQKENKKIKIIIFESQNQIGRTILKTGNGRCNFSNYYAFKNKGKEYYNKEFVSKVMDNCNKKVNKINLFEIESTSELACPVFQFFEDLGLACTIDDEGRMYPFTGKAISVLDVLRYKIKDYKIKIKENYFFEDFKHTKDKDRIEIKFKNKEKFICNKLIITTGGFLYKKNNNEKNPQWIKNYKIKNTEKVLGAIRTSTKYIKSLDGIRAKVKVSILNKNDQVAKEEYGEILFRKYGLSGICIFNLSRFLNDKEKQKIKIDFSPEESFESLTDAIYSDALKLDECFSAERLMAGKMLPNITKCVCEYLGMATKNLTIHDIPKLVNGIKDFKLDVKSIYDDRQCQITRGGISINEIKSNSMESKIDNGVFFAGELIDVDGPCGGYNLHWAWTSGILAGISAV